VEQLVLLVVVELVVILLNDVQHELVVPLLRMLGQSVNVVYGDSSLELLLLDIIEVEISDHDSSFLLHAETVELVTGA
jgi:hypothetical protein